MPLRIADAKNIKKFFIQYILFKQRLPFKAIVNRGRENIGEFTQYLRLIKVRQVLFLAYNLQVNRIVKYRYFTLVAVLTKIIEDGIRGQRYIFLYALFFNYMLLRHLHKQSLFYLLYRYNPVISIETNISTWRVQVQKPNMSPQEALYYCLRSLFNLAKDVELV